MNLQMSCSPAIRKASPRFGNTVKDAQWAAKTLIEKLGVPADLLGSPQFTPDDSAQMVLILSQLSDQDKATLKTMAQNKELSNYQKRSRILPENFEKKLIQFLK